MQKTLLIIPLLIALTATPAFANQGQEKKAEKADKKAVQQVQEGVTPTISSGETATYKSHGDYVSSVAKTHPGGEVVSAAARSDIGKKPKNTIPTPSVSITPSPTAEVIVTPSIEPTITQEPSVTPSEEPTPTATASSDIQELSAMEDHPKYSADFLQLDNLIKTIKEFFSFFSPKN